MSENLISDSTSQVACVSELTSLLSCKFDIAQFFEVFTYYAILYGFYICIFIYAYTHAKKEIIALDDKYIYPHVRVFFIKHAKYAVPAFLLFMLSSLFLSVNLVLK